MILALHLSRTVLVRILIATLALGGLAMALDLVESASRVLARPDGGLLYYMALRAPLILGAVLPVALIVGPVLAFLTLSGRNEFTILRAAGATTYRLQVLLIPLAAVLGLGMHLLFDRVAPRMEAALISWLDDAPEVVERAFWARTTTEVVRARRSSPSGAMLFDVDIFELDAQGRMIARTDAEAARYADRVWTFDAASRLIPGQSESADVSGAEWRTPLTPGNVRALAAPGRGVAGEAARRALSGDWAGNRAESFYQVRVYRGYAAFVLPAVMILLAAPAAFGLRRSGRFGLKAVWAVVLGFGFLLADGMLTSLGESGNMPPAIAAFGAAAIFAAVGLWALVTLEE